MNYLDQRKISTSLGTIIRKDKKARKILLPELAKSFSGRKYFYESFVDFDYLNEYYASAISNHYIKHISVFSGNKAIDDLVFSSSIQFIGCIKANRNKEAIKIANALFKKVSPHSDFSLFNHPFPYGRLQSLYIISETLKNNLDSKMIEGVLARVEKVCKVLHVNEASFILSNIIMSLNYVGRFTDVLNFYKDYKSVIDSSSSVNTVHGAVFNSLSNSINKTQDNYIIKNKPSQEILIETCLLYTSDAADDVSTV